MRPVLAMLDVPEISLRVSVRGSWLKYYPDKSIAYSAPCSKFVHFTTYAWEKHHIRPYKQADYQTTPSSRVCRACQKSIYT